VRPHGRIVTTHVGQIDHTDQICERAGQQPPNGGRGRRISSKGALGHPEQLTSTGWEHHGSSEAPRPDRDLGPGFDPVTGLFFLYPCFVGLSFLPETGAACKTLGWGVPRSMACPWHRFFLRQLRPKCGTRWCPGVRGVRWKFSSLFSMRSQA
jgi:hypothetical protein